MGAFLPETFKICACAHPTAYRKETLYAVKAHFSEKTEEQKESKTWTWNTSKKTKKATAFYHVLWSNEEKIGV